MRRREEGVVRRTEIDRYKYLFKKELESLYLRTWISVLGLRAWVFMFYQPPRSVSGKIGFFG
jgi:hypothetical protein